jgi:ElaB/YqjD/DUF883 family membrane-anchored ribosome-binding protein
MAMKYEEYASNGSTKGRSPAEIESDLAAIRREMSDTIQRIEQKFSPRALVETAFSRARGLGEGSAEFTANLGATVRDNPVPVLLLAAGVASLFAAQRRGTGGADGGRRLTERLSGFGTGGTGEPRAEALKSKVREIGEHAGERASAIGERASAIGERASAISERAGEQANALAARARERGAAASERMRKAAQHARERGNRTVQEEPLVIIGAGLALGALIGAGVPVTQHERRLIPERSRRALRRATEGIGEDAERAAKRVKDVLGVRPEEAHGGTPPLPDLQGGQPAYPHRDTEAGEPEAEPR